MLTLIDLINFIVMILVIGLVISFCIYDYYNSKKPCDPRYRDVEYLRTLSIQEVNWIAKFSINNPAAEQVLQEKKRELNIEPSN